MVFAIIDRDTVEDHLTASLHAADLRLEELWAVAFKYIFMGEI
ncbi:MAG: hypothetical protein ACLFS8_06880 [Clostridia bacterium]